MRSLGERWLVGLRAFECYSPRVLRPAAEPRNCLSPLPPPLGGLGPPRSAERPRVDCSQCALAPTVQRWVCSRGEAQGPWRIDRHPIRPVLKHGPRSLTCARVVGLYETRRRNESKGRPCVVRGRIPSPRGGAHCRPVSISSLDEAEQERTRWDPKDGELCLSRTKPEETLVEVRSDSDVQIDRQTWV